MSSGGLLCFLDMYIYVVRSVSEKKQNLIKEFSLYDLCLTLMTRSVIMWFVLVPAAAVVVVVMTISVMSLWLMLLQQFKGRFHIRMSSVGCSKPDPGYLAYSPQVTWSWW